MSRFKKRSAKITLITLLVYALLVATHEGEFWPFSIYPMFSQAGNPWTRALVADVTEVPDLLLWETTDVENIQGDPVAVRSLGVDQIDFSNFISKTEHWDSARKQALITMFGRDTVNGRRFMIMKADGHLDEGGEAVDISLTPFLMLTGDSVYTNPVLPNDAYLLD